MKIRRIGEHRFIRCDICQTDVVVFPKDLRKAKWHICADYSLFCPVCKKLSLRWRNND